MRRMSRRIKSDGLIAALAAALSELYIPIKKRLWLMPQHFQTLHAEFSWALCTVTHYPFCRPRPAAAPAALQLLHARQSSHRRWQQPGVTVPVFHSLCTVHFTPFLNLGQSQEPLVWACSSPMQQISFSMFLSSLDWGRAVPHEELPAPCKAQVAEPRREPQSSRYKKGDER